MATLFPCGLKIKVHPYLFRLKTVLPFNDGNPKFIALIPLFFTQSFGALMQCIIPPILKRLHVSPIGNIDAKSFRGPEIFYP